MGTGLQPRGRPGLASALADQTCVRPPDVESGDLGSREVTGPLLEGSRLQPWGCRGRRGCSTKRVLLWPREGDHYVSTHTIHSRTVGETSRPLPSARAPRPASARGHGPPAQLATLARPVVSNASPSDWCRPAACALTSPGRVVDIKAWPGSTSSFFPERGDYGKGECGVLRSPQGVGNGVVRTAPSPTLDDYLGGGGMGLPRGSAGGVGSGGGPSRSRLVPRAGARTQPTCRWPGAGFVARPT